MRISRILTAAGPLLALVVLIIGLRLAVGPSFWSGVNAQLVLGQATITAIAACGATLVIVSGGIDLAIGSVIALSCVTGALVLQAGLPPVLAIPAAIATGALAGAVHGSLIAGARLAPFIVTLGMLGIARGLAKGLSGNQSVDFAEEGFLAYLMQPIPGDDDPWWVRGMVVAPGVWILAFIAVGMGLLMSRSVFGRHVYAIGSNEAAARLCGVPVARTKLLIYLIAGAITGLAGLLELTRLHQGDPTTAGGRELDVIAAVVIGGASLSGGVGTVWGSLIGALMMAVLRNGSQQLGLPTWSQEILIGVVIVLAVGIDRWRQSTSR